MTELLHALASLSLALLLGGMVFFPAVVAPTVFKVLQPDQARSFLRTVFPRYYVYIIVTSALAAGLSYALSPDAALHAAVLAAIAVSTLAIRQILVPKLNAWRDAGQAGDAAAQKRFDTGHRASVLVNLLQIIGAGWVIVSL